MAATIQADGETLAELYSESIDSFAKLILALNEPDCDAICRNEVHLPEISEDYGRFKIWGDQSKADLPASARGSLDDILRHNDELKSLVRGILQRLRVLLHQAFCIARRKYNPERGTDQDSVSSVSESDYSTDSEGGPQRHTISKIRMFTRQIAEQIRALHEVSSLLRRPTVTDKFIRSTNPRLEATTYHGSDELHLSDAFELFDENHVIEKLMRWRDLGKGLQSINFSDETEATVSGVPDYLELENVRWFCQRLAKANTRRREQLRYWGAHPYGHRIAAGANLVGNVGNTRDVVALEAQKEGSVSQETTLRPRDRPVLQEAAKSDFSRNTLFSAVAFSDVHDTRTNIPSQTVYAPTAVGRDRTISVPGPPRMKYWALTFSCPYCGMTLVSKDMTRQSWKRHVFRDLRPYICTFQDCHNAEKLFSSRHEWIYHEFQLHRREYVCQRCQNKYANRREMLIHLQEHYGDSIPPAQMDIILELCNRQIDPSNSDIEPCLLCGEGIPLPSWHDHVADHMENLSLFVLPAPEDEEEESQGSIISGKANAAQASADSPGSVSEASSLGFSAAGDHGQTPAEFAKFLDRKEAEYNPSLSTWESTDDNDSSIQNTKNRTKTEQEVLIQEFEELSKKAQEMENADAGHILTTMNAKLSGIYSRYNYFKTTPILFQELAQMQGDQVHLSKRLLGEIHTSTLTGMVNLALTYWNQGRWEEAESLETRVVEARTTVLGKEHPDTLTIMANLASTYRQQGRLGDAATIYEQALRGFDKTFGPEHCWTLATANNLGDIYKDQNRRRDAVTIYMRTLQGFKKVLGLEHILTSTVTDYLANLFNGQEEGTRIMNLQHMLTLNTLTDGVHVIGYKRQYIP